MFDIEQIQWEKMAGLIPVIIQNANSGEVLMLGYMNSQALTESVKCKQVIFYSRSKQRLWRKGESSGNTLTIVNISADCDQDALLIQAIPQGPTCHQNTDSCFNPPAVAWQFSMQLEKVILARRQCPLPGSYVCTLLEGSLHKIAQKVGEEAVETALAAVVRSHQDFLEEAADLLFHLQVLVVAKGASVADVLEVLRCRAKV
jgi:phosphoribosyl-ATP pyrophosphohydrolase/phosphoribosyl-AMP cyclohydrolase